MGEYLIKYNFANGNTANRIVEAESAEEAMKIGSSDESLIFFDPDEVLHKFSYDDVLHTSVSKYISPTAATRKSHYSR